MSEELKASKHQHFIRTSNSEAFVVVEDFETPIELGELATKTYFVEEPSEIGQDADRELFLINVLEPRASKFTEDWFTASKPRVHYWATIDNWEVLVDFVKSNSNLYIEKVQYEQNWIKLVVTDESPTPVDIPSFIAGLSVLKVALQRQETEVIGSELTEPTLKSLLINRLVPVAKPLKRFIPHNVVIIMYKVLEKLR